MSNKEKAPLPEDTRPLPKTRARFRALPVIIFTLLLMLLATSLIQLHTEETLIPRYCKNPDETLYYLEKVMTERTPAGEESRRPYLIAAKLIYQVPQERKESIKDYLLRVRAHIQQYC